MTMHDKGVPSNIIISTMENSGRTYTAEDHVTMSILRLEGDIDLAFARTERGKWKIEHDMLMMKSMGGNITADDDETAEFIKRQPSIISHIRPRPGRATADHIVTLSKQKIELDNTKDGVRMTLTPK